MNYWAVELKTNKNNMLFNLAVGAYIIFCFLVAYIGRDVKIGFWGVLVMSIFLTPLLMAILILLLRPKAKTKKLNWEDLESDY